MGRDLADEFPEARQIFARANSLLGMNLSQICFEGPLTTLTKTEVCQPALLATSIATLEAARPRLSQRWTLKAVAGLSLGEYTALVAAGSLSFEDGLKLVWARGQFMEEAARRQPGTMAGVIGLTEAVILEICRATGAEVANFNAPEQIVISGRKAAVDQAAALAKARGARRVVTLTVGGAFHSSLMQPAAEKLKIVLESTPVHPPQVAVISNVTAHPQSDPLGIRQQLALQLVRPVRWGESMRTLLQLGIRTFFEIGPGTVLKGLMRRIEPTAEVISVQSAADIKALFRDCPLKRDCPSPQHDALS